MTILELREKRAKAWDAAKAFLDFHDSAVDSADGDHLVALLETVTELLELLLLFPLRTDHEKPHHHEDKDQHDPHGPASARPGSLTGGIARRLQ